MSILNELKAENYRLGDLQAIRYDRNHPLFGENYLPDLYFALGAGRRIAFRRENLQMLFCGMPDLSLPAIIAYLNAQKLIILGKWEGDIFRTGGVCWLNFVIGEEEKSGFGAYGFLRWVWGKEEQEFMSWLGLAALFRGFEEKDSGIMQIHGQRYADNHLTARFMARFGFRDLCIMPRLVPRRGKTVEGVVSTLSRENFEVLLMQKILSYQ